MKKRTLLSIFIVLIFSSITTFCQEAWEPRAYNVLPSGPENEFEIADISIVNDDVIWVCAHDWASVIQGEPVAQDHIPVILKSTDGGITWDSIHMVEAIGRIVNDIHGIDEQKAWVTTNNLSSPSGRGLFLTTNGGATWMEELPGNVGGAWLHFFDSMNGVCGNGSQKKVTNNGGASWIDANTPPFEMMEGNLLTSWSPYKAIQGDTIWYGTSNPNGARIFRSLNKGKDWEVFTIGNGTTNCWSTAFVNSKNGLIATEGPIKRSTDGGVTWNAITCPYDVGELIHIPLSEIILGTSYEYQGDGANQTIFTDDLGENWVQIDATVAAYAPSFANISHGWVGALRPDPDSPALYKWSNIITDVNTLLSQSKQISVFPNPCVTQIQMETEIIGIESIRLLDVKGRVQGEFSVPSASRITLDLSFLNQGIYFLEMRTKEGFITKQVVKGE